MKDMKDFSIKTLQTAAKIGEIARKINLNIGPARNNVREFGDMIFFILSNGPDICILRATCYAYFVEYYNNAQVSDENVLREIDYYMIKNIRNFLFTLKRKNFIDYDIWDARIQDAQNNDQDFIDDELDKFIDD